MNHSQNSSVSIDELYGVFKEVSDEELIVDVRLADEYKREHIEDSISLPSLKVEKNSMDFRKLKRIYVVSHDGASAKESANILQKLNSYLRVFYVETGGFSEWLEKKFPTVKAYRMISAKDIVTLDQNEPDLLHVEKQSRCLPVRVREKIEAYLGKDIKIYYFQDKGRHAYLINDLKKKESIVINPLVEVHHDFIDQLVRDNCDCVLTLFFNGISFQDSPPPLKHATDFSSLVGGELIAVDSAAQKIDTFWDGRLSIVQGDNSQVALKFDEIVFYPRKFKLQDPTPFSLRIQ